MTERTIRQFFKELNRRLNVRAQVILLGAGAGSLMGYIRPSLDIDFEIRFSRIVLRTLREKIDAHIRQTAALVGVSVNYSEDVGHWSMVSYLDYRRTAIFYRTFGKITVKLIAPEYWTIGKMTRFLELDIRDMIQIIRKKKLKARVLSALWLRVMRKSDLSLELGQFKEHVRYFMTVYGKKAWGNRFDFRRHITPFLSEK